MAENPQTGELVIAGQKDEYALYDDTAEGVYWAILQADGSWEVEQVFGFDHPLWQAWDDSHPGAHTDAGFVCIAAWDSANYPLFLISGVSTITGLVDQTVWTAERSTGGEWTLEEVFHGTAPDTNSQRGAVVVDYETQGTSAYVALIRDTVRANGIDDYSYRDYLYWYDNGEGTLEDTLWVADQDNSRFTKLIDVLDDSQVIVPFYTSPEPWDRSVWWRRRISDGDWVEEEAARDPAVADGNYVVEVLEAFDKERFASIVFEDHENPEEEFYTIIVKDGTAQVDYPLPELGRWMDVYFFKYQANGLVEAFCFVNDLELERQGYFIRIDEGDVSKEVYYSQGEIGQYGGPNACIATSNGQLYAVVGEILGSLGANGMVQMLYTKTDPRQ